MTEDRKGIISIIGQLKESIQKATSIIKEEEFNKSDTTNNNEYILTILDRLDEQPVDVSILKQTLVGFEVSKLKRYPNHIIAEKARKVVKKWKNILKKEQLNNRDTKNNSIEPTAKGGKSFQSVSLGKGSIKTDKNNRMPTSMTATAMITHCVNVKVAYIRPQYKNLAEWIADKEENFYIGRRGVVFINGKRFPPKDSDWCNHFKIKKGSSTREMVISEYEKHIRSKLSSDKSLRNKLVTELRGKTLGCWCKPEACHGDILIRLLQELSESDNSEASEMNSFKSEKQRK